ncbi:MAG: 3-deoxy-7-phosphoheptulonate synthase, partial [Bryobacteraceae bacterium]
MIIITQPDVSDAQVDHIVARVEDFGFQAQVMRGAVRVVIGVIGSEDAIREKPLGAIPGVESVLSVMKPYKLVAKNGAPPPAIAIGDVKFGNGQAVVLISGPCSVESKGQLLSIAGAVKRAGARVLRGGAFKPRTSPYSFQGLGEDGLRFLAQARAQTGLPIITEIMDTRDLAMVEK